MHLTDQSDLYDMIKTLEGAIGYKTKTVNFVFTPV